ncbi:MAG TPA: HD domain-containing protein [Ktedonobacteraceae bacterium]|jgi:exopolyphosphatase/guanosine-5'-triphosphate,3'-diphosphate pyrophosphatase|nr:HD domain-containing protein [Ktedonobacteraceae bacterium]
MTVEHSVEDLSQPMDIQPTKEELYLSGGLLVEDWPHARHVTHLAVQLFHETLSLHHLNDQDLRLLERAALLHNTGMMIEERRHHKHSFRLIKDTNIPDFSDAERYEIACIARYHRRALPSKNHEEFASLKHSEQKRVSALASLLRIADALDHNHDGRVLRIATDPTQCRDSLWTFILWVRPLADLDEELEHAHDKADLFEKVFKRKVRFSLRV